MISIIDCFFNRYFKTRFHKNPVSKMADAITMIDRTKGIIFAEISISDSY